MPELRHDALTGRLVVVSASRATRPFTTMHAGAREGSADGCPFCPGHEHETPPEIARTGEGAPGTPGWRVRVFPNLYPIVGGPDSNAGATGTHEVVALSPDHDRSFGLLTHDEAAEVMTVLRDRAHALTAGGHDHVQVLVNHRRAGGASIAHPHAQIVAIDFMPPAVTVAVERFESAPGDLVLDDLADARARQQVVVDGDEVAAWCPSGSAGPYEVRVAVLAGGARFHEATDAQSLGAGVVLRDVLAAVGSTLGDPAYNVVVHTADDDAAPSSYHWWVEIVPRTSVVAGFEMGTGIMVNSVDPVDAAARLRDALV